MALVKCPECGRENVSDTAKCCPGCGYNLKNYYENQNNEEIKSIPLSTQKKNRKIIWIAVIVIAIFGVYYFLSRCSYDGCYEKRTSSSKYCYYHILAKSYGTTSSYNYTPKTGNEGALAKAKSYLNSSAFSYTGLIDQLEYEGFSESEATYGADNCGANWKEQALKKAKSYLQSSAFSYTGLIDQLEYNGFTEEEATYGADNCNADWEEQAAKKAKSYLKSSDFSRSRLIHQLQYNGFTYEQAVYGVEQAGL
jgi:SOS response regulatory protein OraA/RecX